MPPVVAAATVIATNVGLVSAAGAVAFLSSTAFVVASWAVTIAAVVAYSSVQQRKMKKQLAALNSSIDQSRTVMVRDPIALRRYVQGQVLVSGPIVYMAISGTNNEFLHLVVVLSDGEVEELGDVYFGPTIVPLDGSGNATGTYAGYATVKKFLGIAAGERDTDLETATGGEWTANHLGKGVARLHVTLKLNADLYTEGIPNIRCMVKGIKHYDPRSAATAYSANSALAVRTFLADEKFGKGIAAARILTDPAEEAANICDEDVVLADASTEKRYESHGVVYAGDSETTLAELCGAMAGFVCDAGGKWTIRAGAWRTPTVSFTEGDMAGPFNMMPRQSRQDTYNGVRGTFISPVNQWAPADFVPVKNDTYKTWDGGKRLWKDVAYNFTTSPSMAQRIAKIDLEEGRQQIVWESDFMLKGVQVQPGDVIEFTKPNLGWALKYFKVMRWVFKIVEANGGPALVVGLQVRETAPGVYDWNDGEETTTDLADNTTLTNPRSVATPATPTLSTSNFVQADGTISPRLKVQWTAPSDARITGHGYVHIEYKKHADADWIVWTSTLRGSAVFDYITDVEAGVSYDVRIRFENMFGVRGAYCTPIATATVSTDTTAPATPTGLTLTSVVQGIKISWVKNSESDLKEYALYRGTSSVFGSATDIWHGQATTYVDRSVSYGTTYYYWLVAIDTTDNYSAAAGPAAEQASKVDTGDVEDGAATTVKLANGAVSQVTAALASSSNGITNNAWTEVNAITVNAAAGQDVILQVIFAYADDGAAHTTDFDVRILRDGSEIDSQDQSVVAGRTELIAWGTVDPDLASSVTTYSVEVRPRGGGGTATPSVRDPLLQAIILKDRLN